MRARSITAAVDGAGLALAETRSKNAAPIKEINQLLRFSNIPVEISVHENEQVLASKLGGASYSIAQLSDGERNAILIAAKDATDILLQRD